MNRIDKAIAVRLTELREQFKLDQREAAHRAGVTPASWRKWEGNTGSMRTDSFLKVGRAFGVSLDWLASS
jgi:transcriptional regulator with XRE-family HTH domain